MFQVNRPETAKLRGVHTLTSWCVVQLGHHVMLNVDTGARCWERQEHTFLPINWSGHMQALVHHDALLVRYTLPDRLPMEVV